MPHAATYEDLIFRHHNPFTRAKTVGSLICIELLVLLAAAFDPAHAADPSHPAFGPNSIMARFTAGETFGLPWLLAKAVKLHTRRFRAKIGLDRLAALLAAQAAPEPEPEPKLEPAPPPPAKIAPPRAVRRPHPRLARAPHAVPALLPCQPRCAALRSRPPPIIPKSSLCAAPRPHVVFVTIPYR